MKTAREILEKKGNKIVSIASDATIAEALGQMVDSKVGAILVTVRGKIKGIWTERDLMRNVLLEGFDPKQEKLADHMNTKLRSVKGSASIYEMMDMMLGLKIRHLPVKEADEYIGLISIGDVTKALLSRKNEELAEMNALVSWRYYEDWAPRKH